MYYVYMYISNDVTRYSASDEAFLGTLDTKSEVRKTSEANYLIEMLLIFSFFLRIVEKNVIKINKIKMLFYIFELP